MTTETLEGHATVVSDEPVERGLAIVPEQRAHLMSGLGAVALLSDDDFARNLELLAKGKARAQAIQKAILTDGVDYGREPGIDRPFLHKPGAEVMEKAYGFATSYTIERKVGDGVDVPALEYIVHAKVHLGDTDGPIIAEGVGSCNTHESKYRFRRGERECPDCHKPAIIKGKADGKLKGKWWCASFKDGCGHSFEPNDARLVDQQVGQVENENPYDLANTILKMARKRAGVDAILTATGTSGLFTQDADSPAVQRDAAAAGGAQQAAQGGDRQSGGTRSQSSGPQLPAIPQGLTAETSLGEVTLDGEIVIGDKAPGDGNLRQGPNGSTLGFRFELPNGAKLPQVIARGALAETLAQVIGGEASKLAGPATVTGEMFAIPWKKKNEEGDEEQMPPFRRVEVTRIQTDEWTLPAAAPVAGAPAAKKPKGKATTKATSPAAGAGNETPASAGPGMTVEAFQKALDANRIAGAYALQLAKGKWPDAGTLFQLTDAQRLELAGELGLLAQEDDDASES